MEAIFGFRIESLSVSRSGPPRALASRVKRTSFGVWMREEVVLKTFSGAK